MIKALWLLWRGGLCPVDTRQTTSIIQSISDSQYLTVNIWQSISDSQYLTVNIWQSISDSQYLTVSIRQSISDSQYLTVNIWQSISDSQYWLSDIDCQIVDYRLHYMSLRRLVDNRLANGNGILIGFQQYVKFILLKFKFLARKKCSFKLLLPNTRAMSACVGLSDHFLHTPFLCHSVSAIQIYINPPCLCHLNSPIENFKIPTCLQHIALLLKNSFSVCHCAPLIRIPIIPPCQCLPVSS